MTIPLSRSLLPSPHAPGLRTPSQACSVPSVSAQRRTTATITGKVRQRVSWPLPPSLSLTLSLDTPTYAPGRFHAHPRTNPIVRIAEDPPLASSTRRPQRRGVSRRPLVEDRAPDGETLGERSWLILRPGRERVELWLETWWRRWAVLVGIPCVFVSTSSSITSLKTDKAGRYGSGARSRSQCRIPTSRSRPGTSPGRQNPLNED